MPETFLIALLAVAASLMVTTWVISLVRRDASIADIAWGSALSWSRGPPSPPGAATRPAPCL